MKKKTIKIFKVAKSKDEKQPHKQTKIIPQIDSYTSYYELFKSLEK